MRRSFVGGLWVAGLVAALLVPGQAQASGRVVHCVGDVGPHESVCDFTGYGTVQSAVDAAGEGEAVLIGPGTYNEAVRVSNVGHSRDGLVIRGTDRNAVRLQGDARTTQTMRYGFEIRSRGVEVANLTAYEYFHTAVYWVDTAGYHGRYLTAFNSRLYGLFAFATSGPGLFEHSYASGHPDAGYYIGQCNPCDARVTDVVAENNGLGYSGTNASGNLVVENSHWVGNGGGIVPNSLDSEEFPPQCCIVIRNNLVEHSGVNPDVPLTGSTAAAFGFGIGLAGGMYNLVENNVVLDSTRYGIVVTPFPAETPNAYRAAGNVVRNNLVQDSDLFDLALAFGSGDWNCFQGNTFETSDPPAIEQLYGCDIQPGSLRNLPISGSPLSTAELASGVVRFESNFNYLDQPEPGQQPNMPNPVEGF